MDLIRNQRVRTLSQLFKDLKKPLNRTSRFELLGNVEKVILEMEGNTPGSEEVCILKFIAHIRDTLHSSTVHCGTYVSKVPPLCDVHSQFHL